MKRFGMLLIPLVLLLIASPSFAVCGYCDPDFGCTHQTGLKNACSLLADPCRDLFSSGCNTAPRPQMLALDYTIASVEVVTPATRTVTRTETRVATAAPRTASHRRQ
jgi:hypothetical protein